MNKTEIINEIKDKFFYEKRFAANQIAPRGLETSQVGNFFAGKTNDEITYDDLSNEACKEQDFYHFASYLYMYPEAEAYFIGLYMELSLSDETGKDRLHIQDTVVYHLSKPYPNEPDYKDRIDDFNIMKSYLSEEQKNTIYHYLQYIDEFYKDRNDEPLGLEEALKEWSNE